MDRIAGCETFRYLDDRVGRHLDDRKPHRHEQVVLTGSVLGHALGQMEADVVTDMPRKGNGRDSERQQHRPGQVGVARPRQQLGSRTGIGKRSEIGKAVADDHPSHRHAEEDSKT